MMISTVILGLLDAKCVADILYVVIKVREKASPKARENEQLPLAKALALKEEDVEKVKDAGVLTFQPKTTEVETSKAFAKTFLSSRSAEINFARGNQKFQLDQRL